MAKKKPVEWRNRIVGSGSRPAKDFTANPANWRKHPQSQRDALGGVLSEIGWVTGVIVNKTTGHIVDGHARVEEAYKLSPDAEVPYTEVELTPEEEATILATLDPISAMAEADAAALDSLLHSVSTASEGVQSMLSELAHDAGLQYGEGNSGEEGDAEPQEDRAEELRVKWGTATGQLWQIGEHRLLCGDSTRREDVDRVMGGERADLCFTSPPYGQQRDYTAEGKEKVSDWDGLMRGVFGNLPMADAGQVLVNLGMIHRDGEWMPYWDGWIEWMRSCGWRRFGWYVWDQGSGLPGDWNGRLAPSHEFVFHFNRDSLRPDKFVRKKEENIGKRGHGTGMRGKDGTTKGMSSPELCAQTNKIPDSVIRVTRHMGRGLEMAHPAVFPVELSKFAMQCWPDGSVYEPFAGSGTTIVAAQQLGRKCRAIEISPAYVAVILERMKTAFPDIEIKQIAGEIQ